MSDLLRRLQENIFLITIVTAVVLGLSLAYAASVGIGYYIRSQVPLNTSAARSAAPRPQSRSVPEASVFENIVTGAFFRGTAMLSAASGESEGTVAAGEITLMGVITGTRQTARALVMETGKEADAFSIGQSVAGYTVTGIGRSYATFKVGETSLRINVGEKSGQAQTRVNTQTTASNQKSESTQTVTLSRERFKKILTGNQADLLKYNKWTLKNHGGKIVGIKLVYLDPAKSFLYQLGARPGDILRRFNGEKLENQAKMLELYQSLMTQDKISVDVERGGKIITFDIVIQ
ncbi:MAG: hypothetical protein KDK39_06330 [Leptospiraceae bacterium]|nr:hypothetical protein [Leptospiraceae bacterium]